MQAPGPKWTDRYLYLGKSFDDRASAYRPVMDPPRISQFVRPRKLSHFSVNGNRPSRTDEVHIGDSYHINRFGSGIREGCTSALFLPAEDYIVPRRFSQTSGQVRIRHAARAKLNQNSPQRCTTTCNYHTTF